MVEEAQVKCARSKLITNNDTAGQQSVCGMSETLHHVYESTCILDLQSIKKDLWFILKADWHNTGRLVNVHLNHM